MTIRPPANGNSSGWRETLTAKVVAFIEKNSIALRTRTIGVCELKLP